MSGSLRPMYSKRGIRVFRYKYFMLMFIYFAPGVEMILLRRILTMRRSTVGVRIRWGSLIDRHQW